MDMASAASLQSATSASRLDVVIPSTADGGLQRAQTCRRSEEIVGDRQGTVGEPFAVRVYAWNGPLEQQKGGS